jgi:hypothetical protein
MLILLEAEVVLVSSVDHLCVLGNFLSYYKLSSPIWAKLRQGDKVTSGGTRHSSPTKQSAICDLQL